MRSKLPAAEEVATFQDRMATIDTRAGRADLDGGVSDRRRCGGAREGVVMKYRICAEEKAMIRIRPKRTPNSKLREKATTVTTISVATERIAEEMAREILREPGFRQEMQAIIRRNFHQTLTDLTARRGRRRERKARTK